jgi:GT2 family glycosyltransferase
VDPKQLKLSIIILFYHGERWIDSCIRSLQNQSLSRDRYEIILVDNGGSTPSVVNYEGQPYTKVLHFDKNLGFAGGNNRALKNAESDLILLINQDVVVHFNCLAELVSAFEKESNAGAIGANMLMVSSKDQIDRHASNDRTVGLYKLTPFGYASYCKQKTDSHLLPVEFISGNAMCFRKSILDDVGNYLFDHRLKSYAEDLDLSLRLKKTKWKIYIRPTARVYHYRDEAFSGNPIQKLQKLIHVSSNRLLVYYKNYCAKDFFICLPALLLGIPLKVLRPDDIQNINILNVIVATVFVPPIFLYFLLRVYRTSKSRDIMSDNAENIFSLL